MATVTRSTRRAEAPTATAHAHAHAHAHVHHHRHHPPGTSPRLIAAAAAAAVVGQKIPVPLLHAGQAAAVRSKRHHHLEAGSPAAHDYDALSRKKARIALDGIPAKPVLRGAATAPPARVTPVPLVRPHVATATAAPPAIAHRPSLLPPPHHQNSPASVHSGTHANAITHNPSAAAAAAAVPTTAATSNHPQQQHHSAGNGNTHAAASAATHANPTKHKEKVINGIRHELDRLQPNDADKKEQGRKLRSQEATRFKSDLSAYFPDYDEVIGNDPKEQHVLTAETLIVVVDSRPVDNSAIAPPFPARAAAPAESRSYQQGCDPYPVRSYGDALFDDLFDSQRIDFSFLEAQHKSKALADPLPDSHFEPAHKKAERLERSIRNTERGRAQHERDQIVRLLDGLQGHDWLRTMGVSGITESRKKAFEPARQYFIKGCQTILEKFRLWALEEKRRKQEKERALAEQAEEEAAAAAEDEAEDDDDEAADESADDDEDDDDNDGGDDDGAHAAAGSDRESEAGDDHDGDGDPPDYSDVDASIARQLHEEAAARSRATQPAKKTTTTKPKATRARQAPLRRSAQKAAPVREVTSFFKKKHERDAALNRTRRGGRRVIAWGEQIPEIPEGEFSLPEGFRDGETMKSRERAKRRERRGSGKP